MNDLAIVLVHYRTPRLLVEACESLFADLATSRLSAELVVVDNGSAPGDHALWRQLPARILAPGENLGYAGGVALGVAETSAPVLLLMNPDVLVQPGCVAALRAALDGGADAAGPQFFWERGLRLRLPPTEPTAFAAEIASLLGRRLPACARIARRLWRRHAHRHWGAREPISSFDLSGALLAVRREAWREIGPFDPRYRLYFEEIDWLLRLRRSGGRARFVPQAAAVHLHAQSSRREPRAEAWFAEARSTFRARRFGARRSRWLERLEGTGVTRRPRGEALPTSGRPPVVDRRRGGCADAGGWIEISPFACGYPAASEALTDAADRWEMPDEVWRELVFGEVWLRAVTSRGTERGPWIARRGESETVA